MSSFLYIFASIILAAIFLVSGVGKVRNPQGTLSAAQNFRLPEWSYKFIVRALPWVEIVLAISLVVLPEPFNRIAGVISLVLMLAFFVLVALAVMRGEDFSCNCFGASTSKITENTVARNLIFVALAGICAWGSFLYPGVIISMTGLSTTLATLLPILLALAAGVVGVWYLGFLKQQETDERISELETQIAALQSGETSEDEANFGYIGKNISSFEVTSDGRDITLGEMLGKKSTLLVYVSPDCLGCKTLVPYLPQWHDALSDYAEIKLLSLAEKERVQEVYGDYPVLTAEGTNKDVFQAIGFEGTPSAALISPAGDIMGGPVVSGQKVVEFVQGIEQAVTMSKAPQTSTPAIAEVGTELPEAEFVSENGKKVSTESLASSEEKLMIFWSETCEHSQTLNKILAQSDNVIVITDGTVADAKKAGLRGNIVQSENPEDFQLKLGVPGTPIGLPIKNGKVSGEAFLGPDAIEEALNSKVS